MVYWWAGNCARTWYRESQIFEVQQAHSRTFLAKVPPSSLNLAFNTLDPFLNIRRSPVFESFKKYSTNIKFSWTPAFMLELLSTDIENSFGCMHFKPETTNFLRGKKKITEHGFSLNFWWGDSKLLVPVSPWWGQSRMGGGTCKKKSDWSQNCPPNAKLGHFLLFYAWNTAF